MRSTPLFLCAAVLGAMFGSAGLRPLSASESAEARAVRLIEAAGGTVVRREGAEKPVVAVRLTEVTLSDDLLKGLSALPELTALDLSGAGGLTTTRVGLLADLEALQVLNLSGNAQLTGQGLFKLGGLKNLRALNVSRSTEIDDQALEVIAELFPKLHVLDVSGCKRITARGLKELRVLSHLSAVNAADCDLTDDAVKELATNTELTHLCVADNARVTGTGLKALGAIENLMSLDLRGCKNVPSAEVKALTDARPKLKVSR